jgi:hypothetical protein
MAESSLGGFKKYRRKEHSLQGRSEDGGKRFLWDIDTQLPNYSRMS